MSKESSAKKNQRFWMKILEVPAIFRLTKDFLKYTKENMPSHHFCCNFLQEGQINLIPLPDCCIFIAVSEDSNLLGYHRRISRIDGILVELNTNKVKKTFL